jgi:hypothetical protein
MQRPAAHHQIEGGVDEGKGSGVALLEQHVRDASPLEPVSTDPEQRRRQVDADDLADVRSRSLGRVRSTTGDVQHDHVRVQRFQPGQRRRGATGEGRVVTGE